MFSNLNSNCSNLLDMRNLQEQAKKAFCYQKLFWPFTAWINCSNDLKNFANSWPSASNFKSFSRSLEQFFLTLGQNNFGKKYHCYLQLNNVYFFHPWQISYLFVFLFRDFIYWLISNCNLYSTQKQKIFSDFFSIISN
jgi:hypothetical protein